MSHSSKSSFLDEAIGLLVQHFGVERVRAALAKVAIGDDDEAQKSASHIYVSRSEADPPTCCQRP